MIRPELDLMIISPGSGARGYPESPLRFHHCFLRQLTTMSVSFQVRGAFDHSATSFHKHLAFIWVGWQ